MKKLMFLFVFLFIAFQLNAASRFSVATNGNWNATTTWSATSGGAAGASVPVAGDAVTIEGGHNVILTANAACTSITFTTATATSLTLGTFQLDVSGAITIPRSGAGVNLIAVNSGILNAGSIAFTSGGGSVRHQITITTGIVTVTGNITTDNAGASASITFTGAGILNAGGQLMSSGTLGGTLTTVAGCTVNYTGAAQTGRVDIYIGNLTLSGSGAKTFATTPTVNGILSLEGTASVVVTTGVVTYGTNATLQYNKPGAYTATSEEWITPFAATGGVIIANIGTITLNTAKVFNNSVPLTINSGATLSTSASNFAITFGGDFVNNGTFSGGTATHTFNGAGAQAINGASSTTFANLTINNTVNEVTLGTAVTVSGTLTFTAGNIVLGANNLTIGGTVSGAAATRCVVTNGAGVVSRSIAAAGNFSFPIGPTTAYYNPVTITNNSGSTQTFTARVATGENPATADDNAAVNRTWNLTGTGNVNLAFVWDRTYAGSSITSGNATSATAWNYTGSEWYEFGGSTVGTNPYTTTITGQTSFGSWTVGLTNFLPVELTSFTSAVKGSSVLLKWITATEVKNHGFDVERSVNNADWTKLGFVSGSGNSNSVKNYSFTDNSLTNQEKYYYRLKQLDNDGSFKYSNIIETEIALPKNFELSQNYPNPFNPTTKISYSLPNDSRVTLEVFNLAGERVAQIVNKQQPAGYYSVNFGSSSVKNIASGIYMYKLTAVDNAGKNFSSIKKMMLLK